MNAKDNFDYDPNELTQLKYRKSNKKAAKQRLLLIFFGTFVGVLILFSIIASFISPKIDLSGQDETQPNVESMSDDNYQGRVNSNLKLIELRDKGHEVNLEVTPTTQQSSSVKSKSKEVVIEQSVVNNVNSEESNQGFTPMELNTTVQQQEIKPAPVVPIQRPVVVTPIQSPSLRNKITQKSSSSRMYKVIVGSYSSPSEAREASSEITSSHSELTPFIKDNNGSYTLQVGSFSSAQKASELAKNLRSENQQVQIVPE